MAETHGCAEGRHLRKDRRRGRQGLDGYRHEFGSLLAAEAEDLAEATRDLVLHLVAAHHGNARPGISIDRVEAAPGGAYGQRGAPPTVLERAAREAALRFVRLQARHGPWGLAWYEEMLRAADRAVSRREAEAGADTAGEAA